MVLHFLGSASRSAQQWCFKQYSKSYPVTGSRLNTRSARKGEFWKIYSGQSKSRSIAWVTSFFTHAEVRCHPLFTSSNLKQLPVRLFIPFMWDACDSKVSMMLHYFGMTFLDLFSKTKHDNKWQKDWRQHFVY